jgi:hypothetical protein
MQFKLHMHDDLLAEIKASDRDPKVVLRDSIARHLKRRFGRVPWFFFIMEDLDKEGHTTRPHAHGSIEIVRAPLPSTGPGARRLRSIERKDGPPKAEIEAGRQIIIAALKAASGGGRPRIAITTGVDQCRNLWSRRPFHTVFNAQWVDYAFKHTKSVASTLGENRLALPYGLRGEGNRLWQLLTKGESAMSLWDQL